LLLVILVHNSLLIEESFVQEEFLKKI